MGKILFFFFSDDVSDFGLVWEFATDGNLPSFSVCIKCDFDYIFLSMCILFSDICEPYDIKSKNALRLNLQIFMQTFLIYYYFSIFVKIKTSLAE